MDLCRDEIARIFLRDVRILGDERFELAIGVVDLRLLFLERGAQIVRQVVVAPRRKYHDRIPAMILQVCLPRRLPAAASVHEN